MLYFSLSNSYEAAAYNHAMGMSWVRKINEGMLHLLSEQAQTYQYRVSPWDFQDQADIC